MFQRAVAFVVEILLVRVVRHCVGHGNRTRSDPFSPPLRGLRVTVLLYDYAMRSPRIGKPRSAASVISSLSRKVPRLALPMSSAAALGARPKPAIGKPSLRDPVSANRNGRK